MVAKEQVVLGPVRAIEPAHHIHAHPVRRLIELDHVPRRLVHRRAILGQQRGVGKVLQEGRALLQHGRHRQQAIEPVAELAREGLADPVRREPPLPVGLVGAIVQRREGHHPGIQPGVAYVLDTAHLGATFGTTDLDCVHVRAVRRVTLENVPARHGTRLELVLVLDHLIVIARVALPDGQRQPPVAFLADHPVVHVTQPVQLAVKAKGRDPANLTGHIHHLVAELIHADKPLVHQTEHQRGLAAPADGIAVGIVGHVIEQAPAP